MLEMINVSKSYGEIKALRETTFSVQPGEIVGIVGKSGSGKTTLLRLLNLMEQPSSGKVLIDGVDVQTLSKKYSSTAAANGHDFPELQFIGKLESIRQCGSPAKVAQETTTRENSKSIRICRYGT